MAKKPKKRGVKPGTKRGPYKTAKRKRKTLKITAIAKPLKVGDNVTIDWGNVPKYSPAQHLTLCGQLEDAILLLENRISNSIAKINSLMG